MPAGDSLKRRSGGQIGGFACASGSGMATLSRGQKWREQPKARPASTGQRNCRFHARVTGEHIEQS